MEPLISIRVRDAQRRFRPGSELCCEYQVDAVDAAEIQAVEASVLWHTEGKGDEDLGVHHFERFVAAEVPARDLRALRQLHTILPNSPLTYPGVSVKIRWCVRVRVFLRRGREAFFEQTFTLGTVPPARSVVEPTSGPALEPGGEDEVD
jgi:hypothetical protein